MKISIATNFENELIDRVKNFGVTNVFGKLTTDFVGGGLESKLLSNIDKEKVSNHVKYAHENGITVNYTLNSPSLSNDEFTLQGKEQLKKLLDWLVDIEVDSVTISIPVILKYIKDNYPSLKVKVSSSVCVNSVFKVKQWEELGADAIVLDPMQVNRNFKLLEKIRKSTDIDLELIVNNNCLYECSLLTYHQLYMGHSSRSNISDDVKDYCYLNCSKKRVKDAVNYLISDIIRPEDLKHYEKIGYDQIKIIDRATPIDMMEQRVIAYNDRIYDGNLLDLVQHYGYVDLMKPDEFVNNIYIDNNKLNGFINIFLNDGCHMEDCGKLCKHCHNFASKAIKVNREFQKNYKEKSKETINKNFKLNEEL